MTVVVDASVVVAALTDSGPHGRWAEQQVLDAGAAPHLLPVEVANTLRRLALAGTLSDDVASLAHQDLVDRRIPLVPYEAVAARAWELRATVSSYDAWYVGVAEMFGLPLCTLDLRLTRAPGPTCAFLTPPAA